MTFKRFIFLGFMLWLLLAVLKYGVFRLFDLSSMFNLIVYGFLTFVITLACVRRLGVINILEAAMVAGLWFVGILFADFVVFIQVAGVSMFKSWHLWGGYGVVIIAILFFHKKRHVQIRRELAAHHAHGGHH